MKEIPTWVFLISFSLVLHSTKSDEQDVKSALLSFYAELSRNNGLIDPTSGWNLTSDPCRDQWKGIVCDNRGPSVKKIFLDGMNFSGIFDASTLCNNQSLAASLTVISLSGNNLRGENLEDIGNCSQLTWFNISGNQFSGSLPNSLSKLSNLKTLDISCNKFSGSLPHLSRISGLTDFLAQTNQLSGDIPDFEFANLVAFNVSFNQFRGPVPPGGDRFPVTSYISNPKLCGVPLPKRCVKLSSKNQILMYSGYALIGVALFLGVILRLVCKKGRKKEEKKKLKNKTVAVSGSFSKATSFTSNEYKRDTSKSEFSATSPESVMLPLALVVLSSPVVNGMKFQDLLKAPAELLGRGRQGSVYKVMYEGVTLAVKRIRDDTIHGNDFKKRMRRLDKVKHPNVLPPLAFYCSKQEKLLVYEYQQNGSLFNHLHGTQISQSLDWTSRLNIAATIADALAFMHHKLYPYSIPHGNLKSSNILLNKNMEPCISEYGLMLEDNQDLPIAAGSTNAEENQTNAFKADVYGYGVILLELLTGKMVKTNGMDLATWVVLVVKQEWTGEVLDGEVLDRNLIQEGASEERMVNLLQIAIKCVEKIPEARPAMNQVALMVNSLKEEDERSMDVSEV